MAREVKKSLRRHLWYLTESLVVLALFDKGLDQATKAAMATSLRNTPKPQTFDPGKPQFPVQQLVQAQHITLDELIGPNSWLLFHLLHSSDNWLALPPDMWNTDEDCLQMESIVNGITVVNDAAERGVKDVQDYANAARDGDHRGQIVLVSSSHRLKIPNFLKNDRCSFASKRYV